MNGFDPTTTSPPATMRDIRALRSDLVEVAEEASRQTLAAHTRTLALLDEQGRGRGAPGARRGVRRAEQRAVNATLTKHLARLVVVPASEGCPAGVVYEPSPLVRRLSGLFGSRPSTTRLLLAATIAAALAGSLSACAAFGSAHAMIGSDEEAQNSHAPRLRRCPARRRARHDLRRPAPPRLHAARADGRRVAAYGGGPRGVRGAGQHLPRLRRRVPPARRCALWAAYSGRCVP
ncbi:MAG: hypothetical protein IPQ09_30840 [Myxococcales bacterium]|nr:hypothetical protein [Myxococcales bacterium]